MTTIRMTRGFTLVELLVVIVIVAIVGAFAVPGLTTLFEKKRLEGDQSRLITVLKEAKRKARLESTVVTVELENVASDNSKITMTSANGFSETIELSSVSSFDSEETIVFNATGTVVPPNGDTIYRVPIVGAGGDKRYVEINASGQIAGQNSGYTP